jgi:hypothetical protein
MRTAGNLALFLLVLVFCLAGADLSGSYRGTWSGMSGAGDVTVKISSSSNDKSRIDISFTIDGTVVKGKVVSLKIDGQHIDITYNFEFDGAEMQSVMTGKINNGIIEGVYKTKLLSDGSLVDEGTCKLIKLAS